MNIARVRERNETSTIAALCIGILSLPRSVAVDALVVPQGEDEIWRVTAAVRDWNVHKTAKYLLIAGDQWKATGQGRPQEGKSGPDITLESLRNPPYSLTRNDGVIVNDFDANTKTQTEWVWGKMNDLGLSSFELHVSPYHLVRWYLTFLKTSVKLGKLFVVIPSPTPSEMDRVAPLSGATPWELVAGEVQRIKMYQEKEDVGDVATLFELQEYLKWLWQQPVLADHRI